MNNPLLSETSNIVWIVAAAALVFVMQVGFCLLESGMVRSKNSINVAVKNLADFLLSGAVFWLVGFSLMFGTSMRGLLGSGEYLLYSGTNPGLLAFFLFQLTFCGTSCTIVSGSIAERSRFSAYLVAVVVMAALIYPVFGHWVWGGLLTGNPGWLERMGFIDFSGSTAVHSMGAWVALAMVLLIGPRHGMFEKNKPPIHGHNMILAVTGTLVLWLGWFGFNGGNTLQVSDLVAVILVNTNMAAIFGGLTGITLSYLLYKYVRVDYVINGIVAGLVAITASCHLATPLGSVMVGCLGALACVLGIRLLKKYRIDDAIGAIPAHGFAGAAGTLLLPFLSSADQWVLGHSLLQQFGVQLLGVVVGFIWAFGIGGAVLFVLNKLFPFRVPLEDEIAGLNTSEHMANTELIDLLRSMDAQVQSGNFEQDVNVEPHTEVGQIARHYNEVLDRFRSDHGALERSHQELQRFNQLMMGREKRISELKRDIDVLLVKMGAEPRFEGRSPDLKEQISRVESAEEVKRIALSLIEDTKESARAKNAFHANVSHELRTPLNGILGVSELCFDTNLTTEQKEHLEIINSSAHVLSKLVDDILDFSMIEAREVKTKRLKFSIAELCDRVVHTYVSKASMKGLKLAFFISPVIEDLRHGDAHLLTQILDHLLSNAVKFTSSGEINLNVCKGQKEDFLLFTVRDTGIGIPESMKHVIFDPFSQADDSSTKNYGGMGLGLAISSHYVSLLDGKLEVESEEGKGSQFFFSARLSCGH